MVNWTDIEPPHLRSVVLPCMIKRAAAKRPPGGDEQSGLGVI